ncbi:MAG: ATPase [Flavobacterium sp. BFFFF1]|uniref:SRPBCC family protein n=1 Tax=unclassified Flavobacterium TaxID=196869 RepID=UPI000BD36F9F|nr:MULTISPECIES: SRPBCC domain-containing protein [unclassified Flavobacterium]OYU79694.1 MAG: ATPase [Flavobacterium sp. BFFFF1]
MDSTDFIYTIKSDKKASQVFKAIADVRSWWVGYYGEEIIGNTENAGDEFDFTAGGDVHFSRQKLIEVVPDKKVVWLITDSAFNYVEKADEWKGTHVIFDIVEEGGQTVLTFTHKGLTPKLECYNSCVPAWSQYLEHKLVPLINTIQ